MLSNGWPTMTPHPPAKMAANAVDVLLLLLLPPPCVL